MSWVGIMGVVLFGVVMPIMAYASRDALRTMRRIEILSGSAQSLMLMGVIAGAIAFFAPVAMPFGLPSAIEWAVSAGVLALFAGSLIPFYLKALRARDERTQWFTPCTPVEARWWVVVSLAAGMAEEIIYRGVLPGLLDVWLPLEAAAALSVLVFGISHIAQGLRGVLLTLLVGAAFQGLVGWSGSLWTAIAVHFLYDLAVGMAGYRAVQADEGLRAELLAADEAKGKTFASEIGV